MDFGNDKQALQNYIDQSMRSIDVAAKNGLQVKGVEPAVEGGNTPGEGYDQVKRGMGSLVQDKGVPDLREAMKTYMDPSSSQKDRDAAKQVLADDLEKHNSDPMYDRDKFFKALDQMRDASKDANDSHFAEDFSKTIGDKDPRHAVGDLVQHLRNETWAKAIKDSPEKTVIFAGAGHFAVTKNPDDSDTSPETLFSLVPGVLARDLPKPKPN